MSQRNVLSARQGSQDCIKHTIKTLRNCFSKKSQHNPGSTLVSSAPNLWICGKSCVSMRVVAGGQPSSSHQAIKPSSLLHGLHVDTFTYVCQCGCRGIDRKWRLCTSDERGLALTFLVRPGDEFTSPQPSATSPFVSTSGKPLRLA